MTAADGPSVRDQLADSPTPGTDYFRPVLGEPETPAYPYPAPSSVSTTKPPAEMQQDDERERVADLVSELLRGQAVGSDRVRSDEARRMANHVAGPLVDLYHRCLAARPSADTETLRDDEMPFVLRLNGQDVTVAEVPDLPERGLTSLSYDYQQRIQVRSVNDLDGRVLLHEVLHALLRTDPQQVCPADDPRHEDFVRMITAGLHDAAGYRRPRAALAARPPAGTETDEHPPGTCSGCGHRWADHHERDGCGACAMSFTRSCNQWPLDGTR